EEKKVASLVTGSMLNNRHLNAIMSACYEMEGEDRFNPKKNSSLKKTIQDAKKVLIPDNYIKRVIDLARQGYKEILFEELTTDWQSDAYNTVSGQNSNNSIRLTNEFMAAVEQDQPWNLYFRTEKKKQKWKDVRRNLPKLLELENSGKRFPMRPGRVQILELNIILRLMNGILVRKTVRSTHPTPAPNICS
ncbi:vitamin B12-dependent ribonucleotide reductase domain protein, partial [Leptospira interrogans serovar Australis str. 200703203]